MNLNKIIEEYVESGYKRDDTYPYLFIDKNNPNKRYYIPACINIRMWRVF